MAEVSSVQRAQKNERAANVVADSSSPFQTSPVATAGLALPNKAPSPPNRNMKHYKLVGIFVKFECQSPLHKRKAPLLLTTFR